MRKPRKIVLQLYEPCPCGKGRPLIDCCLQFDGRVWKAVPSLAPPTPRTGHAQAGCYLAHTSDCSRGLSAEHYVSRSVLETIGESVAVGGAPWLREGEERQVGVGNLTARILCARHNSALSPLDDEAGAFFRCFSGIHVDLGRRSLSRRRSVFLVSGELVELWMLKVACGIFFSRNAAHKGARLIEDHVIDLDLISNAFLQRRWGAGCGLYMRAKLAYRMPALPDSFRVAPLMVAGEKRIAGAILGITGLEFGLVFDDAAINHDQFAAEGWHHRPCELSFEMDTRTHHVVLTWPAGTPPRSIRFLGGHLPLGAQAPRG